MPRVKRTTNSLSTEQIATLKVEAEAFAKQRGHELGEWFELYGGLVYRIMCKQCGAKFNVDAPKMMACYSVLDMRIAKCRPTGSRWFTRPYRRVNR